MVAWQSMAVVRKLEHNGVRYEVRSAGRSLRLYTNGAFHTQYNTRRRLPGGVWDLLALPALAVRCRNALVLGVGGGAVIRLLANLGPDTVPDITGIERDGIHLQLAREYFGCDLDTVTLVEAEAAAWVRRSRRRFDLVIDDLFVHGTGDPERPGGLGADWHARLDARTSARGVLVQNHLSEREARASARDFASAFPTALILERPRYENAILVLMRASTSARAFRHAVATAIGNLDPGAARTLDFRCRQIRQRLC